MSRNNFRIAVIVTTYNRTDALAAVLEGCLVQSDANFEVIVADDGSTKDTADLIATYQARAPFSIRHVWQEDDGFRAAAIRNRALAATQADYIIFVDGDCVLPPDFVASHRRLAERGWFLSGNRLMLTQAFTGEVLRDKLPIHLWRTRDWLKARRRGQIERLLPLLRVPGLGWLRRLLPQRWQGAKTCNLSAWRDDLLRVNGLDESYTGWGLEDSDLVIRLQRAGIYNKSARFSVPVFHLWHRENDRSNLAENRRRLQEVLQATHIRAIQGVNQYLTTGQPEKASMRENS
jgi:glycosyltransferase involved in cell wall biosynthesis